MLGILKKSASVKAEVGLVTAPPGGHPGGSATWHAVNVGLDGIDVPAAMSAARSAPADELRRAAAEFFSSGPGEAVTKLEARLKQAEVAAVDAAAALKAAEAEWTSAVASGADTSSLDTKVTAARARAALEASRPGVLRTALAKAREGAREQLAAALQKRLTELRAEVQTRVAAARAKVAERAEDFLELVLATYEAHGVGELKPAAFTTAPAVDPDDD